ncbi:MAG TPA: metal-sulfur cluster assembly factor [Lapidilactobacillus dextrinicus]|uniref:Metal-sulfur cluster assembly factor n=1 Tax=Lapidilactobacillus dextrinicus TaxID=51664 RepID=A0A921B3V5_9LACO|nr:metal-sulfur cluster assembly factor [Lapidilactobacillus dextrinicus]
MATDEQKEKMLNALESVIDPELGIDIVNLGLIYEVDLDDDGLATVNMTLTTMGCPLTDYLSDNINHALKALPEVNDVEIELVWYPQWNPDMMSRYARISLGIG